MSRARLNIDHLATLLALVECGSFSAAGTRIGLAQSTVSQHLKQLEQALGAALILRGQRGCKPTPAALRLLPYARSLLRLEERVVEAASRKHAASRRLQQHRHLHAARAAARRFNNKAVSRPRSPSAPTRRSSTASNAPRSTPPCSNGGTSATASAGGPGATSRSS